jgi:hypothetical protein
MIQVPAVIHRAYDGFYRGLDGLLMSIASEFFIVIRDTFPNITSLHHSAPDSTEVTCDRTKGTWCEEDFRKGPCAKT